MSIHFDQPAWLWLILLSVPMAAAGVAWLTSMSRLRRWTCVLTRTLLVVVIAGMLAGATAVRTTRDLATIAVIDRSGSVASYFDAGREADGTPLAPLETVRRALQTGLQHQRGPDDRAGVVLMGAEPAAWSAATRGAVLDAPIDAPTADGTDIAAAIRLARAMIPGDATGRLVLISDGNQTTGDAVAEARLAGAAGTPIDVVPLRYTVESEVMIESVDSPGVAAARAPVVVRVVMRSTGNVGGTLELLDNGDPVRVAGGERPMSRRVELRGGRQVELFELDLPPGRVHRFEAVFTPDLADASRPDAGYAGDRVATNNRGESVTLSAGSGSVLIVDGVEGGAGGTESGGSRTLRDVLAAAGMQVELVSPEAAPRDLLALEAYDLVMLANVAADGMPAESVDALARYVTELAGGLVMIGGPSSFGAGGWRGTPIEPLLPVVLDLPEQLIKPSAAIVLVLDNSGSMNHGVFGSRFTQQEIANEGAALAIESMDRTDLLGVITFSGSYQVQIPLDRNREPAKSAALVRRISADGATNCPPALTEAGRMLARVDAEVRHIVVLSDGQSRDAESLPGLCARLAAEGIKVSTIAVGTEVDAETMSRMAAEGGGRFYRVIDPLVLPRILVKAVRVVRSPLVREGDFTPVVLATGSMLVQDLPAGMPPLGGLVLTQPREEPTVVFGMATPAGEPVLAHWNAGLGRVAAFTSDADAWASRWVEWPGYAQMWTRIARSISRPATDRRQELTMRMVGDRLHLRVDATDESGRPMDMLAVPGAVYAPGGERLEVRLSQTAPGRYEGSVGARSGGTYIATLAPRTSGADGGVRALPPVVGGISRPPGAEYSQLRSDDALLEAIAETSGGRVIELADLPAAMLFERAAVRPNESRLPLWPMLLVWCVVLMLADVGTRRIAWDRLLSREFGASMQREARAAMQGRGKEAAAAADRLRKAEAGRTAEAVRTGVGPLDTADAIALAKEQAARRRQARADAKPSPTDAGGREAAARRANAPVVPEGRKPDSDAAAAGGGLLAAKRRAQRKIEEQKEDGSG